MLVNVIPGPPDDNCPNCGFVTATDCEGSDRMQEVERQKIVDRGDDEVTDYHRDVAEIMVEVDHDAYVANTKGDEAAEEIYARALAEAGIADRNTVIEECAMIIDKTPIKYDDILTMLRQISNTIRTLKTQEHEATS